MTISKRAFDASLRYSHVTVIVTYLTTDARATIFTLLQTISVYYLPLQHMKLQQVKSNPYSTQVGPDAPPVI